MEVASRSTESRAEADKTARLGNALGWFSIGLGLAQITAPRSVARLIGLKDDGKSTALVRTIGVREVASGIGLLSQPRTPGWMWSRVAGDVMDLAILGSALNASATNRSRTVAATAAVLGVTALDVLYGQQLKRQQSEDPMGDESGTTAKGANREVTRSITISRPPDDVYPFWRRLDNLPQFMRHLESVEVIDQQRSHWRAKGPADKTVEWDAIITQDRPNELIAWQAEGDADVYNEGTVRFRPAPGGRGTEVTVDLRYDPPGGAIGAGVAKLLHREPGQQVYDDLRRLKQVLEIGEVVVSDATAYAGTPHPAQPDVRAEVTV